ncbi:MAG: fumarate hydratase [Lentisphaeria bacterium]|jgi:fumarate hydratase class I|nr:fumarate hydratase [Lentisphaeria bacterium]
MSAWTDTIHELIANASTDLPADVEAALQAGLAAEEPGSNAAKTLATILENTALARRQRLPLCQDTGTLVFTVHAPPGLRPGPFREAALEAIARATAEGVLRRNSVDTLTGENAPANAGPGHPVIHWHEHAAPEVRVSLLLKGGGSENVGIQYSLPDKELGAGRDLEGVRRCLLDAVHRAQGQGCAPGILGVAIGGDRGTGYAASKEQLLRRRGERSPQPELAALETRVLAEANTLGIGPMGYGGKTTILEVFITAQNRLPASYFVSVSYMCWACRRHTVVAHPDGRPVAWE